MSENTSEHRDEQHKGHGQWNRFTEEIEIAGRNLVDEVTKLIAEGNVRKLRVRSRNDDVVIEVPMNAGVAVGGVVVLAAPWLAILGALAGVLAKVRLEVVRVERPESDGGNDQAA